MTSRPTSGVVVKVHFSDYFDVEPNTAAVVPPGADATLTLQAASLTGLPAQLRSGAITFAMNAIVLEGFDATLRVGQDVTANWRFD